MSWLEDLVRPGHGDRDGWTEAEADHEKTTVARPWVAFTTAIGCQKQTSDLDAHWDTEEEGAVMVEAVREGCDQQDSYEIALCRGLVDSLLNLLAPLTIHIGAESKLSWILVKFGLVA